MLIAALHKSANGLRGMSEQSTLSGAKPDVPCTGQNRREDPFRSRRLWIAATQMTRPKFHDQVGQCCKIGPGTLF